MSEKVLGFRKKDAEEYGRTEKTSLLTTYRRIYKVPKAKLVPVVELEEHEREVEKGMRLYSEAVAREALLNKKWLAWLEKQIDKVCKELEADRFNTYGYEQGFDRLLSAAKKEAGK